MMRNWGENDCAIFEFVTKSEEGQYSVVIKICPCTPTSRSKFHLEHQLSHLVHVT
jgi:hypothetical protein